MPRFNRVYYHYELLEEYTHGMWRIERGVPRCSAGGECLGADESHYPSQLFQPTYAWRSIGSDGLD